jgi:hypothetical protein
MTSFPRFWFVAWLLVLGIPFAANVLWARAGYPEGEDWAYLTTPLIVAGAATMAWGFGIGRRELWGSWVVSGLVGASVMVIFAGIADKLAPSGGEGYVLMVWLPYWVAISVLMVVGAGFGFASSHRAGRKER